MRAINILIIVSICLLLAVSAALAGPTSLVRVGYPQNGISTDVIFGLDIAKFALRYNALEATLNGRVDDYSYNACELGYHFKTVTPFITVARVSDSHYKWVPDGDSEKRELLRKNADTSFGAGIHGEADFGRWVIDGSYRAFNYSGELNGLLKTDIKYRLAGKTFLGVSYTRWDSESANVFNGVGFGLQLGW